METKGFLKRAYDSFGASAFITTDAEAIKVNPAIWDTQLRDYQTKNIVYTAVGTTQFDFRKPGRDMTVTIDGAPTAASDLVETNAVAIQAMSNRQVTFDPSERGVGFEVSLSEMEDAFFPVMENMTKKVAYALALKKDALGVTEAQTYATTQYVADNVVASNIASSNTLDLADFTRAVRAIKNLYYTPTEAFICPSQEEQILNITQVQKANEFGTRSAIESGLIGQLFGVKIYVTHSIPVANNRAKMIVQGTTGSGEKAVGYAVKRDPTIGVEENKVLRKYTVFGTERYDFAVLHPDAIVTVESYAA
jgi:hypothetical protein